MSTTTTASAGSWRQDALCAETDPEAFYPAKGASAREAKRICRACTVRIPCREEALARGERFGIWGGLSERERRGFKKQRTHHMLAQLRAELEDEEVRSA